MQRLLIWKTGLSPLAWGTHEKTGGGDGRSRFIPAGVGNTRHADNRDPGEPVYPRWRGEHIFQIRQLAVKTGLSPLAWGTPVSRRPHPAVLRFIPAGVGNTSASPFSTTHSSVYPRWRGEHHGRSWAPWNGSGLSPLAWGTLLRPRSPPRLWRFIPAGVGNTGGY